MSFFFLSQRFSSCSALHDRLCEKPGAHGFLTNAKSKNKCRPPPHGKRTHTTHRKISLYGATKCNPSSQRTEGLPLKRLVLVLDSPRAECNNFWTSSQKLPRHLRIWMLHVWSSCLRSRCACQLATSEAQLRLHFPEALANRDAARCLLASNSCSVSRDLARTGKREYKNLR